MKKKIQKFDKNLKMPHLFREDLENIELIIKNELKPNNYKLESESYEYSEIAEIKKNTAPINQFRMQSYSPDIIIELTNDKASIHADDDSVSTMGTIKKILNIVEKRGKKFLYYSSHIGSFVGMAIVTFSTLALLRSDILGSSFEKKYLIFILFFSICWFIISIYVTGFRFSIIDFAFKEDKTNFFSRNKDQVLLGLIISVMSFLLGKFL